MKKDILIISLILLVGALVYWRMSSEPTQQVTEVQVPKKDAQTMMLLARGVQVYCVDEFKFKSCMNYASKCGEECHALLSQETRTKIFNEYNKYRVAHGMAPLIPVRRPASY